MSRPTGNTVPPGGSRMKNAKTNGRIRKITRWPLLCVGMNHVDATWLAT